MIGNILVLETSTESGSVAIARDAALIAEFAFASRDPTSGARTEALGPAIANCLELASISARDLSAVVCGAGPGGFTSLRAAAAFAKGLCSALRIPLYAVPSLEVLAWTTTLPDDNFVVALHAGRNEWFAADASRGGNNATTVSGVYLVGDVELRGDRRHRHLVGPGLEQDITPSANAVVAHLDEIAARGAVNLDSWEPGYGRLAEAQVKWEAEHGRPLSL